MTRHVRQRRRQRHLHFYTREQREFHRQIEAALADFGLIVKALRALTVHERTP